MRHPAAETVPAPAAASAAWSGQAFGLDLHADFPVEGLTACAPLGEDGRRTQLVLAGRDSVDSDWQGAGFERLRRWATDDGEPEGALDHHPELGYRLSVNGYGVHVVSADASRIGCAPPVQPGWSWQRCLVGQLLPLAAVLRGREVFHASAVSFGGGAAAFVGASAAGKTSVAVNLVLQGARLLTDDVLAVASSERGVTAYPGAGVVSLRHAEALALAGARDGLGRVLGDDGEALRTLVERDERPLPLGAVYFLERGTGETQVEPLDPDPRLLLGSTFNFIVQTPARRVNQLEVCARIATTVPAYSVRIAPETSAAGLAGAIRDQVAAACERAGER